MFADNVESDPLFVHPQDHRLAGTIDDPHFDRHVFIRQILVLLNLQLRGDAVGLRLGNMGGGQKNQQNGEFPHVSHCEP